VLAAPLAAQAQTANVTLYGRINMNLEWVDADQSADGVARVSANSSRFGIRGTESLGGGLNAIFQVESSVNPDSNSGGLAGRESFVGLQGSWGTVKLGGFLAPYDDIHGIFGNTPTLNTSILATSAVWANNGGNSKNGGSFDARLQNSIRYDTPNISGFTGGIQVSLGENSIYPGDKNAMVVSAGGFYTNGPLQLGLAVETNREVRGADLNDLAVSLTGAYNFGSFRLAGLYERLDYETPLGDLKRDFYAVSGIIPIGPGTLFLHWGFADDGDGADVRIGGLSGLDDSSANMYIINYTYPLSKRTAMFVGYSHIDNDSNAAYNFGVNAYPGGACATAASTNCTRPGSTIRGFALGMWHNF
jgi:predicted porin